MPNTDFNNSSSFPTLVSMLLLLAESLIGYIFYTLWWKFLSIYFSLYKYICTKDLTQHLCFLLKIMFSVASQNCMFSIYWYIFIVFILYFYNLLYVALSFIILVICIFYLLKILTRVLCTLFFPRLSF